MKKLFALFMVAAMLSVAGSAMAVTVTASPTSVAIDLAGSTKTATSSITYTATQGGKVTLTLAAPIRAGATLSETASGATVTFAPIATGDYKAVVTATETYTTGDTAGHSAPKVDVNSVDIAVKVTKTVTPRTGGGSSAATEQLKPIVKLIVVKVIKIQYAVMPTFAKIIVPLPESMKTKINDNIVQIRALIAKLIGQATVTGDLMDGGNIDKFSTSSYVEGENEENLKKAAARLLGKGNGKTKRVLGVIPPFKAKKSGLQPLPLPAFDAIMYGQKPAIDLCIVTVAGSFAAAAEGDVASEAVFLDSTGTSTDVVPDGTGDANAGELTAVVYVAEGSAYEPVVYTTATDSLDKKAGTSETTAEITENVTVKATDFFNPAVDDAVVKAVSKLYGASLDLLPFTAAGEGWTPTDTEKAYMKENNLVAVCALPQLSGIADGAYIAEITFDTTPSGDVIGIPMFYPDGIVEGGNASSKIYVSNDATPEEVKATNAKEKIKKDQRAYLVFKIANGKVTAAAGADLTKPAIIVTAEGHTPTPTEPDPVIDALKAKGYVSGTTITDTAFDGGKPKFSALTADGKYNMTVKLLFDVAKWTVTVADNGSAIKSSKIGQDSLRVSGDRTAIISLTKSEITEGTHAVTLSVRPKSGDKEANSDVTASLGSVEGTPGYVTGVGSSSGGCSAGSAVLAMALLGVFIASRKK